MLKLLLLSVLLALPVTAQEDLSLGVEGVADVGALKTLPVQHEGRLKPLESFSRHVLLQLSGRSSYKDSSGENHSALEVMTRLLMAPESVGHYRIFLINNPEVAQALEIPEQKRRRYSFQELEPELGKLEELARTAQAVPEDRRSAVEKDLLRAYQLAAFYSNLVQSLYYAIPSPMFRLDGEQARSLLTPDNNRGVYSFWELMGGVHEMAKVLEGVDSENPDERSDLEQEVIRISQRMFLFSNSMPPTPLHLFPPDSGSEWRSPSELVANPALQRQHQRELDALSRAVKAYRQGDQHGFDSAAAALEVAISARTDSGAIQRKMATEAWYQQLSPFYRSLNLYWLALVLCFLLLLKQSKWVRVGAWGLLGLGFAFHVIGIAVRMYLTGRPPVTNLYETFVWVSAVLVLIGFLLERQSHQGMGLFSAAIGGVTLLTIAGRYANDGDTMGVLVAVLDSNFWLSTHVITINIGYSAGILAGILGHLYLLRAALPDKGGRKDQLRELYRMIYGVICFSLLFSFFGTMLGGIWADQSWGRFWGWDPKENGALLIVIWAAILLHAKQWGQIKADGMAHGSIVLTIIVFLAWFGVNLLSIGLHSYGFTEGAATKLFVYIGLEIVFMAGMQAAILWQRKREKRFSTFTTAGSRNS